MKMINFELILNVWIAMLAYNLILSSIGKALITYFLDHSHTIQKEKKSFQDKLKEKMKENNN